MSLILNIETSTKACSVALGKDGELLVIKESNPTNNPALQGKGEYIHSEKLTEYIAEIFSNAKINLPDLDAVAVSKGPGSYTGLRIGVSTAKGLCYALDKPLLGIETLKTLAAGLIRNSSLAIHNSALLCPMLDARRMEVYCAIYDTSLNEIKKTSAEIIDENSFDDLLNRQVIYFFGEGAEKCKKKLSHPNALFIDDVFPSAKNMIPFSEKDFREKKFEDIAYFEPFYLKDFVGTVSKK